MLRTEPRRDSAATCNPTDDATVSRCPNVVAELTRLKKLPGKDIVQYGLGPVSFTLLEHGLPDELRLWIHPMIRGRQGPIVLHFRDCPPAQFHLLDSSTLPNGIGVRRYALEPSA